jgi:hypothetical protein
VDKSRVLIFLHPEFNQNNKALGHSVMAQVEALSQLPAEQFGSREKHQAIEVALNKALMQDVWRQKQQSGALPLLK